MSRIEEDWVLLKSQMLLSQQRIKGTQTVSLVLDMNKEVLHQTGKINRMGKKYRKTAGAPLL